MSAKAIDLRRRRFGRLKVIERVKRFNPRENRSVIWRCVCDCGNECEVSAADLRRGGPNSGTRSCGCMQRKNCAKVGRKYGAKFGVRENLKSFRPRADA